MRYKHSLKSTLLPPTGLECEQDSDAVEAHDFTVQLLKYWVVFSMKLKKSTLHFHEKWYKSCQWAVPF